MSQNDLAKQLNVSNKTISKWECNKAIPDIDILNHIANIFNISLDELTNTNINLKKQCKKSNKLKALIEKFHLSKKRVWIPLLSIIVSIVVCISCLIIIDKKNKGFDNSDIPYITSSVFDIDNDNKKLFMSVSNKTSRISLIDSLSLKKNFTWSLYTDLNCKNEIPSKSIELNVGDNQFFIMLRCENKIDLYTVNIRRRPTYMVSFESKITDNIQNQLIEEGSCAIIPTNIPTKIGYEFIEWKFDFNQPITSDIKIYGNYNPISYNISIIPNGGVCKIDKLTVKPGDSFSIPEPQRDGYLFSGWFYGDNYYNYRINSNIWKYETIEIYAGWRSLFKMSNETILGLGDYLPKTITDFTIPQKIDNITITKIENNAFENETQIEKITIPDTVSSIGESAFYGCSNLKEVILPNNIPILQNNLFYKCNLLSNVNMPNNLSQIGDCAFYMCNNLKEMILPDTITSIGHSAFYRCINLTNIHFPEMLREIGSSAFDGCSNLEEIILPNLLEVIGYNCFRGCNKVEKVTIPRSVTTIGRQAFANCINMSEISLFSSKETIIEENTFTGCNKLTKCNIESIVNWLNITFSNNANPCQFTKNLFINNTELTELIIPTTTTKINDYAFVGCESITKITIPNSVVSIGKYAFSNCSLLNEINFDVNCDSYWHEYNYMFKGSGYKGDGISLNIGDNVKTIPYNIFGSYEDAPKIKNVVFSNNSICTEIQSNAFGKCKDLISITLPNSLLKIGEYAFHSCEKLTTITIPSMVKTIRRGAFYNTGLTTAVFNTNLNWDVTLDNSSHIIKSATLKDFSVASDYLVNKYSQYYWSTTNDLM